MKLITVIFILSVMCQDNSSNIYDFKEKMNSDDWIVLDDGVMGGLSKGTMSMNETGKALFKGNVSTENNGGFSSVRHTFDKRDVSKFKHVLVKVRGDGKSYQFRIKESTSQRHAHIATFSTTGDWETIKIPFDSFYASFRGYQLDMPNYSGNEMEEIAFFIGNKTNESFALEIEKIYLE